jgi:hypothetical protein
VEDHTSRHVLAIPGRDFRIVKILPCCCKNVIVQTSQSSKSEVIDVVRAGAGLSINKT